MFGLTNKEFCEEPSIAEMMGSCALSWHCELAISTKEGTEDSTDPDENSQPCSPDNEGVEDDKRLDQTSLTDVILLQYTSGSTGELSLL